MSAHCDMGSNVQHVIVSFCTFGLIHIVVALFYQSSSFARSLLESQWEDPVKRVYKQKTAVNVTVSLIHSSVASILVYESLKIPLLLSKPVELPLGADLPVVLVSLSTGYFLWDTVEMAWNGLLRKQNGSVDASILAHHVVVSGCFLVALTLCTAIPYLVLCLCVELNSVFLHIRTILQIFCNSNERCSKLLGAKTIQHIRVLRVLVELMNFLTFIAARYVPYAIIYYLLAFDYNNFPNRLCWWLASCGLTVLLYVNTTLFMHMAKSWKGMLSRLTKPHKQ